MSLVMITQYEFVPDKITMNYDHVSDILHVKIEYEGRVEPAENGTDDGIVWYTHQDIEFDIIHPGSSSLGLKEELYQALVTKGYIKRS